MSDLLISIEHLKSLVGSASAPRIFDVRRRAAFEQDDVTLPTASWRDHTRSNDWLGELAPGQQVVVACAHGGSVSQLAAAALRRSGIEAHALVGGIEGWKKAGGITLAKSPHMLRDDERPSRWVTRVRPKIDRIACPWLIRRFIDSQAEFYFVEPACVVAVAKDLDAVPYDIDGVEMSHDGELCTFDTLIAKFGLKDAALDVLARIVRGADTARPDLAPEAPGLLAVSLGISALSGGDDRAALERGFSVYDALYAWQRHAAGETHNWPATSV